jgi:class 3 adenylate cyclase
MREDTIRREVAILFTDLVSSSQVYDTFGDEAALELVRAHFKILETALAAHGGRLVKTIGDAVFGVFDDPAAAVRCAVAMHEAIRSEARCPAFRGWPVRIRAGVHYGPGLAVGGDVFGDTVNVASRVVSLAGENEVLCTNDVLSRLPADMSKPFEFYAPIIPKGTYRVIEVLRQTAGQPVSGVMNLSVGTNTMAASLSGLDRARWRFDEPPPARYTVAVRDPSGREQVREVGAANVLVGRAPKGGTSPDIRVDTHLVSRIHVCFRVVRRQLWVFDLDSMNGVFIRYPGGLSGEVKVKNQAPIIVGTTGRFGDCVFECRDGGAGKGSGEALRSGGRERMEDSAFAQGPSVARSHRAAEGETPAAAAATPPKPAAAGRSPQAGQPVIRYCGRCCAAYHISRFDPSRAYSCPTCKVFLISVRPVNAKMSDTAIDLE